MNGNGFEVIFDIVGGKNFDNFFEVVVVNGIVVIIVVCLIYDFFFLYVKGFFLYVIFMVLKILYIDKCDVCWEILIKLM